VDDIAAFIKEKSVTPSINRNRRVTWSMQRQYAILSSSVVLVMPSF
jgi:hypothetical protein